MQSETKSTPDLGLLGAILGILALVVAVVAVAFTVTDDEAEGEQVSAGGGTTRVELGDFFLKPASASVPAGGRLELTNTGSTQHNLSVVDEGIASEMIDPGGSASLGLGDVEPGTYKVRCDVPGHEAAGMAGELTVTAGDSGTATGADEHAAGDHGDMTWEEMDASMLERVEAFPQKTSAQGGTELAPTLVDGVKQFDLTAKIVDWEVEAGKVVEGWSYNGIVPGPVIKVDVGDRVRIVLKNELPESTGLHIHGVEKLPNAMDGVPDITQDPIEPGRSFTYEFTATAPAVAMYHSHHNATKQVGNGMLGALLIGRVALPAGSSVDQEIPMVLNDTGTIGFSLNGKSFPATAPYAAKIGDQILVHYMNEGVTAHPMHLHGMPGHIVARDGYPTPVQRADTISIQPGERVSVLYDITEPGVWAWHCHILPHAEASTGMFGMVTALIVE